MTRTANARLAGFTFLFYIAAGITGLVLFGKATRGAEDTAAQLAAIARNAGLVHGTVVLTLVTFLCAIVLGVTLYALTRDVDQDLAMIAMLCRVGEGVVGAASAVREIGLVSVAQAAAAASGAEAAATNATGALLLGQGGASATISATCFAIGSTIFSYLFLRARSIPLWLAWLGVVASILLVVLLPARMAGYAQGTVVTNGMWLPMLVFEVTLAVWLMVKGVAAPASR